MTQPFQGSVFTVNPFSQGSTVGATLGWITVSLWDSLGMVNANLLTFCGFLAKNTGADFLRGCHRSAGRTLAIDPGYKMTTDSANVSCYSPDGQPT